MQSALSFLFDVARDEKVEVGKKVIVIGGGNTAMDAARTSVRLGADVTVLYRRTRIEMPALEEEIVEAEEEGVRFHFLASPLEAISKDGQVALTCIRMELGEPDDSGRRRPVPVNDSEFTLSADLVLPAIGQAIDPGVLDNSGVAVNRWGFVQVDEQTLQTNHEDVFSGGDCLNADIAATAVGHGRIVAASIDQYLRNEKVTGIPHPWSFNQDPEGIPPEYFSSFQSAERVHVKEQEPGARRLNFDEIAQTMTAEQALAESARCLSCQCASFDDCKLRKYAEEYDADQKRFSGSKRGYGLLRTDGGIVYEPGKCIQCGICVRLCEKKGKTSLGFLWRGFASRVGPALGQKLAETLLDEVPEVVDHCPSGALTRRIPLVTGKK